MKVLVTGANGLLGRYLVPALLEAGLEVIATSKGESRLTVGAFGDRYTYASLDITDGLAVHACLTQYQPHVVIHAAALTQVDACELNQELATEVNVQGTAELLIDAESLQAHFIYISTDFVFDGQAGPYGETDPVSPVNWYGFTKIQAEAMVMESTTSWAIVRTCLVYGHPGAGRSNLISWVRKSLLAQTPIQVVQDQFRTPTYAGDLAQALVNLTLEKRTGLWHISGGETMTPYDMALATAEALKAKPNLIEPVHAGIFKETGTRPPRTGFLIDKALQAGLFKPLSFSEGLAATLSRYDAD